MPSVLNTETLSNPLKSAFGLGSTSLKSLYMAKTSNAVSIYGQIVAEKAAYLSLYVRPRLLTPLAH